MSRNERWLVLAIILMMISSGCGYHFAASGTALPPSAHTIYIAKFANRSRITGVEFQLDRYLKDEVAKHKRLTIVDDPAAADLVLTGTITDIEVLPAGFNGALEPTTFNYSIGVNAQLIDNHTKTLLWRSVDLTVQNTIGGVAQAVAAFSPSFVVQNVRARDLQRMTDYQVYYVESRAARQQAMKTIASEIYDQMSEGF